MSRSEALANCHLRRRSLLIMHMSSDRTIAPRQLTKTLRRSGFRADSNSTAADLRWFRNLGIELGYTDNPLQQQVDKIIRHWGENRP